MDVSEPVPEEPAQIDEAAAGAGAGGPPPSDAAARAAARSRINFPESDSEDSDEEGGKESYAGGSTSSGNVVIGPGKKGNKDIVGKLFRRAKESGAEEVQPGSAFGSSAGTRAFVGGGFKLGGENTPSVAVGTPSEPVEQPRTFVLKMWQDGFSIDDGDIREYKNPENKEFLASIMR